MNNIFQILFLTAFIQFQSCVGVLKEPDRDMYNLGFEIALNNVEEDNSWVIYGIKNHRIDKDSLNIRFGRYSAKINVRSSALSDMQVLKISQIIPIPELSKSISVSTWVKGESLTNGYLKIVSLNSEERVVSADSVIFGQSLEWKKYELTVKKPSDGLYIEYNIGQNSQIWLDNLCITIDGKDLYSFQTERLSTKLTDKNGTQKNDSIEVFRLIQSKRIIGIGESVHGLHEMAISRNQIIKHLVTYGNCKLILFEAPDFFVQEFNRFINGELEENEILTPKNILKTQFYIYSDEVLQLLRWLKEYNSGAKRRVTIVGMDVSPEWKNLIYKKLSNKTTECKKLLKYVQSMNIDSASLFMDKNRGHFVSSISINGYDSLYVFFKKLSRFILVNKSIWNNKVRDSIMAKNIEESIEKYTHNDEKIIVCSHLSHINKIFLSNSLVPSLGSRLYKSYNDQYFVIAQLAGSGTYQAYQIRNDVLNIKDLSCPNPQTIEYSFHKQTKPLYTFTGKTSFNQKINLYRDIGGIPKSRQFYPGNMRCRADAIAYFPIGTPLHYQYDKLKQYYNNRKLLKSCH